MKALFPILGIGGIALLASTASCGLLSPSQPPAAQPVIVTNNIPSGNDSGTTVLLTVAGIAAFLLLGVAIVAGMLWFSERRRRMAAEDTVIALLTGRPISQLALAMAPPISAERLQATATPIPAQGSLRELQR